MSRNDNKTDNAIEFLYNPGWAKRKRIKMYNILFQGYRGTAINIGGRGLLSNKLFEDVTIKGCSFINCAQSIKTDESVLNLQIDN